MSLFNLLTYLRLKLFALFLRTSLRLLRGLPRAHPDGVLHIPSRDPGRTIKLHVYHGQPSVKPQPVLINFHGSGFVVPVHGQDDEFCRLVSRARRATPCWTCSTGWRPSTRSPRRCTTARTW